MSTPAATTPLSKDANNPAIFKVLEDGTVLYKTWEHAEAARLQQKSEQRPGETVKKLSQVKSGEKYLSKDGTIAPYTLGTLVEFQVTGLIVVVVVLTSLSLICAAIGRFMKSLDARKAEAPVLVPTPPTTPVFSVPNIHPGLTDQQLLAVLTAAASEVLKGPVRIEKFRPSAARDLNWSAQGRQNLQDHRLK